MLEQHKLAMFTGSQTMTRYSPLFRNVLLSEGAMYVAENGGRNGAFWLMDAIASHQPKVLRHDWARGLQLWKLQVHDDQTARLTCREDTGVPPVVSQEIEYTDFEEGCFRMYAADAGDGQHITIFLPSEY